MMIHHSTPNSNRCMLPPILKPWPFTDARPLHAHISLQWARNHLHFIGYHAPPPVSNVKSGADIGMAELEAMWWSKVAVGLQGHWVSIMEMSSPFSFIFMWERCRDMYEQLLEVIPHLTVAEQDTWDEGLNEESINNSECLQESQTCHKNHVKYIPATAPKGDAGNHEYSNIKWVV